MFGEVKKFLYECDRVPRTIFFSISRSRYRGSGVEYLRHGTQLPWRHVKKFSIEISLHRGYLRICIKKPKKQSIFIKRNNKVI